MKGILPLQKNEALRAKERVRDLLAFYPTGHFVHLLSSLKRGIHFCFNTSFLSPAHLSLVSTITTAGRDGRGKRTNSVCNVGQQAHLFMMGWPAAKWASADSRFQHGSTEATWQTDPAALRASFSLSLSVIIIFKNLNYNFK